MNPLWGGGGGARGGTQGQPGHPNGARQRLAFGFEGKDMSVACLKQD